MSTHLFLLTASFVSPNDAETPHDVLAAAEVNGVHEVYPEALADPPMNPTTSEPWGPAWVEPQAAGVLTAAQLALLLGAVEVGIEGAYDEGTNSDADAVVLWLEQMRANITLDVPA